jgi:hypothetical protein
MTTALVPTGIITICCGNHETGPPGSCCENDCSPCCPECPTCPTVQAWTPAERRRAAAERRILWADAITLHRAARDTWLQAQQALHHVATGSATPIFDALAVQLAIHPDPAPIEVPPL